jgi:hypothetical protein
MNNVAVAKTFPCSFVNLSHSLSLCFVVAFLELRPIDATTTTTTTKITRNICNCSSQSGHKTSREVGKTFEHFHLPKQ